VTCTCELQLDVDKLNVEEANTLSFKVSVDALMVHWWKKQAELTVQSTDSKDDLPCTVSVHSCRPSSVYSALCLFSHAVHQLSTMHCVCSLMLPICLWCTMSFHSCYPSVVYLELCTFSHAAPMSTMHCVCSIMS
jgi:hypothetical protein